MKIGNTIAIEFCSLWSHNHYAVAWSNNYYRVFLNGDGTGSWHELSPWYAPIKDGVSLPHFINRFLRAGY